MNKKFRREMILCSIGINLFLSEVRGKGEA